MIITFKDYVIESDTFGGFHLKKNVIRNRREIIDGKKTETGDLYEDVDTIGYNMSLESCMKRILHLEICNIEETKPMKEALREIRNIYKEIEDNIKI